jgi:hypothetical protein
MAFLSPWTSSTSSSFSLPASFCCDAKKCDGCRELYLLKNRQQGLDSMRGSKRVILDTSSNLVSQ